MTGPVVEFGKEYPKLFNPFFNTIRKSDKGLSPGQRVVIKTPLRTFKARVAFVEERVLKDLPTSILTYDTDTLCRMDALDHLNQYYPYLTWESVVYLIGFERCLECSK